MRSVFQAHDKAVSMQQDNLQCTKGDGAQGWECQVERIENIIAHNKHIQP